MEYDCELSRKVVVFSGQQNLKINNLWVFIVLQFNFYVDNEKFIDLFNLLCGF